MNCQEKIHEIKKAGEVFKEEYSRLDFDERTYNSLWHAFKRGWLRKCSDWEFV